MDKIKLTLDGKQVEANESMTVLEAARDAGIYIPTLCYHPGVPSDGSCELCLVEIEGRQNFPLSCVTPATEGMVVYTDTPQVRLLQRDILKRLLAKHTCACLTCERREHCQPFDICLRNVAVTERCVLCPKNGQCELQKVADYIGLEGEEFSYSYRNLPVDKDNPLFERDYNAVFLALGAHRGVRLGVEGENSPGVIEEASFLRKINLGRKVDLGDRVAVIGGRNAAIDSARTALRLGTKEVTIIYRRTRAEMPELAEEQRTGNFAEVELGLDEQVAVDEAKRCLQCAVRLQIPSAPLPPVRDKSSRRKEKIVV